MGVLAVQREVDSLAQPLVGEGRPETVVPHHVVVADQEGLDLGFTVAFILCLERVRSL